MLAHIVVCAITFAAVILEFFSCFERLNGMTYRQYVTEKPDADVRWAQPFIQALLLGACLHLVLLGVRHVMGI